MNDTETTAWVECSECQRLFERGESEVWKKRCLACWRRSKPSQKPVEPDAYAAGYRAGFAARLVVPSEAPAIDKDRLRALIQLCHPDKHAGSELAGAVTAWLLSMRGKQ